MFKIRISKTHAPRIVRAAALVCARVLFDRNVPTLSGDYSPDDDAKGYGRREFADRESGDPLLTEAGEPILATVSIYALTSEEIDILCAVPREWSAAHIDRIYLVLVPLDGYAWGIPESLEWGEVGKTWGGGLTVSITC